MIMLWTSFVLQQYRQKCMKFFCCFSIDKPTKLAVDVLFLGEHHLDAGKVIGACIFFTLLLILE